jgi:hypothetical protein
MNCAERLLAGDATFMPIIRFRLPNDPTYGWISKILERDVMVAIARKPHGSRCPGDRWPVK